MDLPLDVPSCLRERAGNWHALKRWERRELGQELRRLGLSYREIAEVIPVAKGTLSGWCRDLEPTEDQKERLLSLRPSRLALQEAGLRRRRRNLERIEAIRRKARTEVQALAVDPFWVAGVVAYWSEGTKRGKELRFSNSDPALVILFVRLAIRYLGLRTDQFSAQLHLHDGQDELERKRYWSAVTGIPLHRFCKSYIKPEGTGHRKNVLYNGTVSIRPRRSGDLFHRVMGWIEELPHNFGPLAKLDIATGS